MTSVLKYAFEIRQMVADLEAEAGLDQLGEKECYILFAFVQLAAWGHSVRSVAIRSHPLVAPMTHPTYHRTLRSLQELGFVAQTEGTRSGYYALASWPTPARWVDNAQARTAKGELQCRDNYNAYGSDMRDKLERVAKLREMLLHMEGELGLSDLSRFQRDLLYAVRDVAGNGKLVKSADLRSHNLTVQIAQPTFYRALRELIARGYLRNAEDTLTRYYVVNKNAR